MHIHIAKRPRSRNSETDGEDLLGEAKDGARFKTAPAQARNVAAYLLGAIACTCIGVYGYQMWADSHRSSHPACNGPVLQSECAWELSAGLPSSLSYWLLLLWVHCLSSAHILLPAQDLPYHPTRRTYYIRLVKTLAVFYLMIYPAVHQVFFLLLSRDSTSSFPARFSVFLLRQISVMSALFAVVFSWTRRRRDSPAAQLYWVVLTVLYVLQGSLTSWHAQNTALASVFHIASVPHIVLIICILYASRLERWEEEEDLVWLRGNATVHMGSKNDCELRLPLFCCSEGQRTPPVCVSFAASGDRVVMQVRAEMPMSLDGKAMQVGEEAFLSADERGTPSVLCLGQYYAFPVRRRNALAIRLRSLAPPQLPLVEVDELLCPYRITTRDVNGSGAQEGVVSERDLSVMQVMRLLGQQLPDAKAWAALALALIAGMGYSWCEMEALNSQGTILGGAPAAGSQVDAAWNVTRELFFFMLWSVVMYSCQVLNKLASGVLRVSLGLQIRRTLLPILHNRGEERAAYAIGQQCPTLDERLDNWLKNGVIAVCQLFFGFAFLTRISLPLTGVVLGASSVYTLIIVAKLLLIAWISDRRELANSRLVAEALIALKKARGGADARPAADQDFLDNLQELYPEYMSIVAWESVLEVIDLFSYTLVLVAALWFGAVLTQDPEHGLSAEEYVAYSLIAQTFAASLSDTCSATTQFTTSYATVVEVARLLAEAERAAMNSASLPNTDPRESVVLPLSTSHPSYESLLAEIGRSLDRRCAPPTGEVGPRVMQLLSAVIQQ